MIQTKRGIFILILTVLFFAGNVRAQNFYRITGEFSIKKKATDKAQLVIGKFYYDKNERKIVHDNFFPEKERWITSDTSVYKIENNTIVSRQTIPDFTDFSIYNMILSNKLDNFGLEGKFYELDKVDTQGDMVVSTWIPKKALKDVSGNILISSRDNNIFGIVFFNKDGELMKKQFFEDYQIVDGLAFPGRIVEITYVEGEEIYQVTTYKNIKVNDHSEESMYKFNPADYR